MMWVESKSAKRLKKSVDQARSAAPAKREPVLPLTSPLPRRSTRRAAPGFLSIFNR